MDPGGAHQLLVRRRRIRQASPGRYLLALGAFPGEGMDGGREAERGRGAGGVYQRAFGGVPSSSAPTQRG